MPNTNEFHMYIHLDDVGGSSSMAGGGENEDKSQNDKTASEVKSAARKIVGYAAVKSTADQIISGQMRMVELSTGATEYEERLNAGYNIGKQIWNAAETIAVGAATGGIWGAVAGLVVSGVSQLISYGQRVQRLALNEGLENISIDRMIIRAGVDGRRGRTQ